MFSVWITLKWKDFQMGKSCSLKSKRSFVSVWNPVKYGGLTELRVAPDKVWLPGEITMLFFWKSLLSDIVLFNNAGRL